MRGVTNRVLDPISNAQISHRHHPQQLRTHAYPTGKEIEGPAEGLLALKNPWPSAIRSIHGNHTRMEETYFSYPGTVWGRCWWMD